MIMFVAMKEFSYMLRTDAKERHARPTSGAMTGRIDRLERDGLVERTDNPGDRRGTIVKLTQAGFALIDAMMMDHVENERRVPAGLTRPEEETLAELLAKLLSTLPEPYKSEGVGG